MRLKPKHRRLAFVVTGLALLGVATGLVLNAMSGSIAYFQSPSDLAAGEWPAERGLRLGGLVEAGSVEQLEDGLTVQFLVTDGAHSVPVIYRGLLPNLFREGQGVVAEGRLDDSGRMQADRILAKHDETYMPPEVADALKRAGHWQPEAGAAPPVGQ